MRDVAGAHRGQDESVSPHLDGEGVKAIDSTQFALREVVHWGLKEMTI